MQSEVDLLKQRITELEARKAELEVKNAEIPELRKKLAEVEARNGKLIKQIMEENNRRDAKIKNTTDRVAKLEQKQLLNDNAPNNNSSDFNSGKNHHEKSLEDKEIDAFLIDVYKKSISDEIRQHNKEKTIQHEIDVQDDASGPACITGIVAIVNNLDELGKSSCEIEVIANTSQDHAQKYIANSIVPHDIKTVNLVNDQDKLAVEPSIVTEFIQGLLEELLSSGQLLEPIKFSPPRTLILVSISIKKLANSFCQVNVARGKMIIAKQTEITAWCLFSERFEDKVVELRSKDKKLVDKTARSQIYAEMKPYLTGISDGYLCIMTCKARKINKLFGYEYDPVTLKKIKGIGGHIIQRVTCSADKISKLTNPQIEHIIEQVNLKMIANHVNEISLTVVVISAHDSNFDSEEMISDD
uniref:Uncharacterized protein n=2 Tax=Rhizophagus irregularis (strain DAOM 181602 / DAOM 197198 / MUCL 43194) TaxID=747089 RepID=U9TK13_RHIID